VSGRESIGNGDHSECLSNCLPPAPPLFASSETNYGAFASSLTETLARISDGDVRSCSFPHLGPAPFAVSLETSARLSSAIRCSQWAIFGNDDAPRQNVSWLQPVSEGLPSKGALRMLLPAWHSGDGGVDAGPSSRWPEGPGKIDLRVPLGTPRRQRPFIQLLSLTLADLGRVRESILHASPDMHWNFYTVSAWPGHERNLMHPYFASNCRNGIAEGENGL
jgi:hypothetical protein